MESELHSYLKMLVADFNINKHRLFSEFNIGNTTKVGQIPKVNSSRNDSSHQSSSIIGYDVASLRQKIKYFVKDFESSKKIYDYVVRNSYWHNDFENYEVNANTMPSINSGITAGFLCRNFELNNWNLEVTQDSFNKTFEELIDFFKRDFIEMDIYINLIGVNGDVDLIHLSENVTIKKAGYELAKIFCFYYSIPNYDFNIEVFPDDYLLHIKHKAFKKDYSKNASKAYEIERALIGKWNIVPIIALPGYVEIRKSIYVSKDWPIIYHIAGYAPGHSTKYNHFNKRDIPFNDESIERLKKIGKLFDSLDADKLDKRIHYSIERLKRAKCAIDINDRLVELAIALEYLFNTGGGEVTLQLSLKVIKLLFEQNEDESIYNRLKKFYDLRSKIIHGNDIIKLDDTNKALIEFAEDIIQQAVIRIVELSNNHNYDNIQDGLKKSLHLTKTLNQILTPDSEENSG